MNNTQDRWFSRAKHAFVLLIVASGAVPGAPIRSEEVGHEFSFESPVAKSLVLKVRKAHGLVQLRPLALEGTDVRGDMNSHVAIFIDSAQARYQRSGATINVNGASRKLTGKVTHILDGDAYRKIPAATPSIAAVARPRIETEFRKMSVVLLLHPPRGRRMSVRTLPAAELNGESMNRLLVSDGSEAVCTLFIRVRDAVVAGWSTMADTSVGFMPQVVVVEDARTIDGTRVPVALRERTGDRFGSLTHYTTVLVGAAASRRFLGAR